MAHILLSGDDRGVQIGNFIGDSVKGNAYNNYPANVRCGILLHRFIDDFTDHHPLVREATGMLKDDFGRYSGVLTDIIFDHLLAVGFDQYSDVPLSRFSNRFYRVALMYYNKLPAQVKGFLWHFILTNRLCRYATPAGIRQSLEIMVRYKNLPVDPVHAIAFLQEHYTGLDGLFRQFFPEIQNRCTEKLIGKDFCY